MTATSKKRGAIDFGAGLGEASAAAEQEATDRFAKAMRTVQETPTGLSPITTVNSPAAAPAAVAAARSGGDFDIRSVKVGSTYDVPLSLIDPNPYSPRHFYKSAQVDETALSMQAKGQKVAANGFVTEAGRVQLIEGGTRLRAARAIGAHTLEVKIEEPPKSVLEQYLRGVEFHDERTNHTALDTAVLLRKLLDEGAVERQDELAAKIKINGSVPSPALVSKYLRIAGHIPNRLLMVMADHEATSTLRVAYAISSFFVDPGFEKEPDRYEQMAEETVQETVSKSLSARDVEALVAAKLAGPKTRARAEATPVKMGRATGAIKLFEARGQLDFSIKGLDPETLSRLKATIESICAGRQELANPVA